MYKSFLIKYGEIGIKGKNRYLFEDALVAPDPLCAEAGWTGNFTCLQGAGTYLCGLLKVIMIMRRPWMLCSDVFGIVGICPVVQAEDKGFEELGRGRG